MGTLSKPILCNLSIRLPESLKMRLRCGTLTVNDLMDMMIDTLNNFLGKADRNAGAMEEFAGALTEWADGVIEEIRKAFEEGGSAQFVLGDGDVELKHLSEEVQAKINAGGGTGGASVIDLAIDEHGVVTVVTGSGEDDGYPCGLIPFISDIANVYGIKVVNQLVSGVPTDMDTDKVAGLLTMSDWIKLQQTANRKEYVLPQASASTYGGVKVGSGIDVKSGVISTSLEKLGLSLKGDVLTIGGKSFKLTAVEDVVEEYVSYGEAVVTAIGYGTMNNNGDKIMPQTITFSQTKETTYSDGREPKIELITGDMNTAGATFHFAVEPASDCKDMNLAVDSAGGVTANGSRWVTKKTIGKVNCTVDYNGVIGTEIGVSASIEQSAATLSVSPDTVNVDSAASGNKYFTIKRSSGVTITGMTSSAGDWVTPGSIGSDGKVYLTVKANAGTDVREAEITVKTNIGNKVVKVKQAAGTVESASYMVYGTCMSVEDIEESIAGGSRTEMTGKKYVATMTSNSTNKANVHFVAITNDGKYDFTSAVNAMSQPIEVGYEADAVETVVMDDMLVWYMYRGKGIYNTTKVTVEEK